MNLLPDLITDRTAADVDEACRLHAKFRANRPLTPTERAAWLAGLRGCYNVSDMNRVALGANALAAAMAAAGYAPSPYTPLPETRSSSEFVPCSEFVLYLESIQSLRAAGLRRADTPPVPEAGAQWFDYRGANAVERILVDIESALDSLPYGWCYCGETELE